MTLRCVRWSGVGKRTEGLAFPSPQFLLFAQGGELGVVIQCGVGETAAHGGDAAINPLVAELQDVIGQLLVDVLDRALFRRRLGDEKTGEILAVEFVEQMGERRILVGEPEAGLGDRARDGVDNPRRVEVVMEPRDLLGCGEAEEFDEPKILDGRA